MGNRGAFRTACTLLWILCGIACADLERGDPPKASPDAGDTGARDAGWDDGPNAIEFARDVHPILIDACGECHAGSGSAAGTAFLLTGDSVEDAEIASGFVAPGQPDRSRLLTKATGTGHSAGAVLEIGSDSYRVLHAWITGGAQP